MIPEQVFQKILLLGEAWGVRRMDYVEARQMMVIQTQERPALWAGERCPHCQATGVRCYDHAPERRWRHLNVCQLQSEIVCALPRGQCPKCQKVYTVRAPWEGRSRGLTQEFEAFALTLMREMPVSKAGEILGETDQKLWRSLFAHVDAAWADLSWENVVWVGADEMNRKKGHNYLTVFVDLEAKRVLLAVEGKDAGVWEQFAGQLLEHNSHPKAITQIAIDMSPAYQKGAREQLAKTSWLWRKNPETWTEKEGTRWLQLQDKPLVTGLAYAMRLELQKAYAAGTIGEARRRFQSWCRWVRTEAEALGSGLLEPMRQTAAMVERHLEGILAHWKEGLTTAFMEGLNSLFSATKRKARGYRSSEYQIAMLYFVAGKLEIPYYG